MNNPTVYISPVKAWSVVDYTVEDLTGTLDAEGILAHAEAQLYADFGDDVTVDDVTYDHFRTRWTVEFVLRLEPQS